MLIVGHRGARALEPENTLRALEKGMKCADVVEVDVRLSSDGIPVVMHDADIGRTTDGEGPVNRFTLKELKGFDAGMGERIPTLREIIACVKGRSGLVIEIKEPGSEEVVCTTLRGCGIDRLFVVSFHKESIIRAKKVLPGLTTGFIFSGELEDPLEQALAADADIILPKKTRLTIDLVTRAHEMGLMVIAWTLNTPEDFRKAVACGVDGCASDDPCAAREYLAIKGEPGPVLP